MYKQMVRGVADDMGTEDVQKIAYDYDLPTDYRSKPALEVLRELENRGNFSNSDIRSLLELLRSINRCDLINKHVKPYQQQSFSLHCDFGHKGEMVVHSVV